MSRRKGGYEFPNYVRNEAWKRCRGRCERCGKKTRELELHHIIPVNLAKKYPFLAPHIIASLANAKFLCKSCHSVEDRENERRSDEEMIVLAQAVLGIAQLTLF